MPGLESTISQSPSVSVVLVMERRFGINICLVGW
jgi:hypothetical protein